MSLGLPQQLLPVPGDAAMTALLSAQSNEQLQQLLQILLCSNVLKTALN